MVSAGVSINAVSAAARRCWPRRYLKAGSGGDSATALSDILPAVEGSDSSDVRQFRACTTFSAVSAKSPERSEWRTTISKTSAPAAIAAHHGSAPVCAVNYFAADFAAVVSILRFISFVSAACNLNGASRHELLTVAVMRKPASSAKLKKNRSPCQRPAPLPAAQI